MMKSARGEPIVAAACEGQSCSRLGPHAGLTGFVIKSNRTRAAAESNVVSRWLRCLPGVVRFTAPPYGPDHASQLIGNSNGCFVMAAQFLNPKRPTMKVV
jgi:hypothetical protein